MPPEDQILNQIKYKFMLYNNRISIRDQIELSYVYDTARMYKKLLFSKEYYFIVIQSPFLSW